MHVALPETVRVLTELPSQARTIKLSTPSRSTTSVMIKSSDCSGSKNSIPPRCSIRDSQAPQWSTLSAQHDNSRAKDENDQDIPNQDNPNPNRFQKLLFFKQQTVNDLIIDNT